MQIMRVMQLAFISGLLITGLGLYLMLFTSLTREAGVGGIYLVVAILTIGLFLLIPAKIYLIIQLMKREKKRHQ